MEGRKRNGGDRRLMNIKPESQDGTGQGRTGQAHGHATRAGNEDLEQGDQEE